MKIEEYELGQKVSLYGVIEEINIEDIYDKENTTTLSIKTVTGKIHVNPKWEEVTIDLDQPKIEVPQFVADWYEEHKLGLERELLFLCWKIKEIYAEGDFEKWFDGNYYSIQTLINMHQFGYTVEKEKLYTVEIPNPNEGQLSFVLMRQPGGNVMIKVMHSSNLDSLKTDNDFQLTEQEIRKDFDWTFRWAEEVTK